MDHYVDALRKLCDTHGGFNKVAEAAGVNGQTLYQIVAGVKLPSGNSRGVGPNLRKKLTAAFPLWLSEFSQPQEKVDVFSVMTAAESELLYNFRSLTDDDQAELFAEIAKRAAKTRAHVEKVLNQIHERNGVKK